MQSSQMPAIRFKRSMYRLIFSFACVGFFMPQFARAATTDTLSIEEIVERTETIAYYQGKDGKAQVSMTITDPQGRTRQRRFIILRRNQIDDNNTVETWSRNYQVDDNTVETSGAQKYYVYLQSPADIRNTVFMVWKQHKQDDDRWLYLPALDLVKRIAAGDKRTSFLGSDFYYEDISGRSTTEDKHELLEVSEDYYIVKNTPISPKTVGFSYYTMWIHRDSFVPVRIEYFDKKGEKYRIYDALGVQTFSGYPTVVKSRMRDLRRNSETELAFSRVEYDIGIQDDIFSERYLRNPPTRYVR